MKLTDLLDTETVLLDTHGTTKPEILAELTAHAAQHSGLDHRQIFRAVLDREALVPSALGFGAAMPHAGLKTLRLPYALLARLPRPVDFHAWDARPVDLVILILGPDPSTAAYLQLLRQGTSALRDPLIRQRLRHAADAKSMPALLREGVMA